METLIIYRKNFLLKHFFNSFRFTVLVKVAEINQSFFQDISLVIL